jgi:MYXO-CTERM domain-containing protein
MLIQKRIVVIAIATSLFYLLGAPAQARSIAVDFDGSSFATTGEIFNTANTTFGTGSGAVPFNLNFGSGSQAYDFCFNGNGFVSFVASGSGCGSGSTPTGDYVAPFLSTLTTGGNTLWSTGLADPTAPYATADAAPAMRFIWDATDSLGNSILVETLLIDQGAGNFNLEFQYGSPLFGVDGAPGTGQQGFSLGTNVLALTSGPFATATDYVFSFVGGLCTTCGTTNPPPTNVPEPSPLALMASALLALPLLRRRLRIKSPR